MLYFIFVYTSVRQKFYNILVIFLRHNSAAPGAFADFTKATNYAELRDAEIAWYSLSATYWIQFKGLKHGLGIHGFKSTWHSLIDKVLTTWTKFLEPSGYCSVINCVFIFDTINVFCCFGGVIAHFQLIKYKLPN